MKEVSIESNAGFNYVLQNMKSIIPLFENSLRTIALILSLIIFEKKVVVQ